MDSPTERSFGVAFSVGEDPFAKQVGDTIC